MPSLETLAREVGLPAVARCIEAQCRAKAGAEGGIRPTRVAPLLGIWRERTFYHQRLTQ